MKRLHRTYNFYVLLFSRIISELGSAMFTFSLSLFVLDTTGSALKYSFILTASIFTRVIANTIAGVIVDRFDKKALIIFAEFLNGFVLISLYVLFILNEMTWMIACVGSVLLSMCGSLLRVSIHSSIPTLLDELAANKANALFQSIGALVLIVGPLLAAVLYEWSTMAAVLLWSSLSYAASGLLLIGLTFPKRRQQLAKATVFAELKETMSYIRDYSFLSYFLKISSFMNFILYPMMILVLPYIVYQVLKVTGTELAVIQACWALGMIGGSLTMLRLPSTQGFIRRFFDLLMLQGVIIIGWSLAGISWLHSFGNDPIIVLYCGMVFMIGVLQMFVQIPLYTYFQFRIAEQYRGKVWGVANTLTDITAPLGIWVYGLLLEGVSWVWIPIVSGIVVTISSALFKSNRAMQRIDKEIERSKQAI
ncbi:MFS transporter [Paenibacillus arenosi]|uniref:MFS transporter n=1 Tax=Paenibacillus arenosi TaxID=2774142 RepID=A0ABR9B105_9BACL|nr:MFS transporter [Paenibacillus arenosi]MBD8499643.1 MFS transporter [Paenibacillus arenosi]